MYCQKCGSENAVNSQFCSKCGTALGQTPTASISPNDQAAQAANSFSDSIKTCFSKYATFTGRARRPEYWWFVLFAMILGVIAIMIDSSGIVSGLFNLILFIPSISVCTRRLHDTNHSGWWQLISITIIGIIPLLIWLTTQGDNTQNNYGDPV